MPQMSTCAYERILDLAIAALHERCPDRLWPLIATELPRACGGEFIIRKSEEWGEATGTVHIWTPNGPETDTIDDQAGRVLRRGYPWADYYASTTDRTPLTACQVTGERAWHMSTTARVARKVFGTDHALALPLSHGSDPVKGYLIYRSGTDFTTTHLTCAQRLQPLLDGIERQHEVLMRWREVTASSGAELDPVGRADSYGLTPREMSVLALLSQSLTAAAIGRRLGISLRTVHKHIENLYRKMGTTDRVATVLRAQACGLLPA